MKRRAWKWALGLVAGAGVALGGLWWSAQRRADEVFRRHDGQVKAAIAAIRARPSGRPALNEPAIPGNGWKAYLSALKGFDAIPPGEADEIPSIRGDPEFIPDRKKLATIFEKYAPLVDELRKSSWHDQFIPDYDYEAGLASLYPNLSESLTTAKFLSGLAIFLHEEGEDGPASEALTLGLAMGHDTGRSGVMLHFLMMMCAEAIETESMRQILTGHAFEAADLESFARKMDRLWEARPSVADALEVEDATIRRTIVAMATGGVDLPSLKIYESQMKRSWRFLFSHRLAYTGALGELERACQEARGISGLAPHLRPAEMVKVSERTLASKNPIVLTIYPALGRVYLLDGVARMRWTLMRVATAVAWYESEKGQVPERLEELIPRYLPRVPICPLTGLPLGYRHGTVWSVGKNGVDDGGTPGKNDDADDEDGDVVWRVTRE